MNLSPTWINSQKTECSKGHPFTEENTSIRRGRRHCRTCQREYARQWIERNKDAVSEKRKRARAPGTDKAKIAPTREFLLEVFDYDPASGRLTWKSRPDSHFRNRAVYLAWHRQYPGTEAGRLSHKGYRDIRVCQSRFQAHRLIWIMMTGEEPKLIDHINGDKSDNRFENLRSVDDLENSRNQSLSRRNKSGYFGVRWVARDKRWFASITIKGKQLNLGYYRLKADAIRARKKAEREHGFHPNHGRPFTAALDTPRLDINCGGSDT